MMDFFGNDGLSPVCSIRCVYRSSLAFRVQLAKLLVSPHLATALHRHTVRPRLTQAERLVDVGQHMPCFKPGKSNNRDCRV